MSRLAEIIPFSTAFSHDALLYRIKKIIRHSPHPHEQTAYSFICDLEELADNRIISLTELTLIIGKAEDILAYFRYDAEKLAHEATSYRASVIHQMSCGMLQALRLLRPDLHDNCMLGETAYNLYRYHWPMEAHEESSNAGPVTCKRW